MVLILSSHYRYILWSVQTGVYDQIISSFFWLRHKGLGLEWACLNYNTVNKCWLECHNIELPVKYCVPLRSLICVSLVSTVMWCVQVLLARSYLRVFTTSLWSEQDGNAPFLPNIKQDLLTLLYFYEIMNKEKCSGSVFAFCMLLFSLFSFIIS